MPGPISIEDAERIRLAINLNKYEFSVALGYSPTAYLYALDKDWLSRKMAARIEKKYRRMLEMVRK